MSFTKHSLALAGAFLVAPLVLLAGCTPSAQPSAAASGRTLTVFAAASLKGSFTKIADAFAADHPGTKITYNFDGSSALVDQLKGGASADVFASADEANMKKAADASLISGTPKIFATNVLTLVVAPGNPKHITGLDSSLASAKLVVCAHGVPCGSAFATLEKNLGVTLKPVSEEQKVTDVLGKVISGEADAGVVYATDAKGAADKVTTVGIPGADKVINRYPIAATAVSKQADLAAAFIDFVASAKGQDVLASGGFGMA